MKFINSIKEKFKQKVEIIKFVSMLILLIMGGYSWVFPLNINEEIKVSKGPFLSVSIVSGILFFVFYIVGLVNKKKNSKKICFDIIYILPIITLEILTILICFNCKMWGIKNYIIGVVAIWLLFVQLFVVIKSMFGNFLEQEKMPIVLMVFVFLFLLFAATNDGLGESKIAQLLYQISCGMAYWLAFGVYTYKCLYGLKDQKGISNILGVILIGGLIVISFPFYVERCGMQEQDFGNFVTVYAAVIGGGITLAGVAWTIKDSNQKHQAELQRIEEQRKQDERRMYRPFLNFYDGQYKKEKTDILVYEWLKDTKQISKEKTDELVIPNYINNCYFVNTDFSNFYVWGLKIGDNRTYFDSMRYIRKDGAFYLKFSGEPIFTKQPIESISLILEDMLENLYELPLTYKVDKENNKYRIDGNALTMFINNIKEV